MYKILANTIFLGKDVHFLSECHSTNDKALQLVRERTAKEGTIIITENQTLGKGQRGNTWSVEPGKNLTFSLVLRPDFLDVSEQFYLNMAISNSIYEVLVEYTSILQLKWPNDLIVPGFGKLGGILIENSLGSNGWEYAVVGLGLNVNQVDFPMEGPTSLRKVTGSELNLEELFRLLITRIERHYLTLKKRGFKQIKNTYLSHLFLMDEWAEFQIPTGKFIGKIVGVDSFGRLEIESKNGEIQCFEFKTIQFPKYHS